MWNPDQFLEKLYSDTVRSSLAQKEPGSDLEAKREEQRNRLWETLGPFPEEKAPLEPKLLERLEYQGLIIEKLEYSTYEGLRVPVYALYPQDRQGLLPGVLMCHGHGPGHRAALGMNPDGTFTDDPGIHNRAAIQLAQRGMFVLVPEIIGFGDRRGTVGRNDEDPKNSTCLHIAMQLLMCGMNIAGFRVYEATRGLDYLGSRLEVDPARLGALGFSGGGLVASLAAAVDPRIQATVLCGYTSTYKGSILTRTHCVDNYIPGILHQGEQPELIGLLAPRALFVESGTGDLTFPIEAAREAYARLENIYAQLGAAEQLEYDWFEGKHEISGRKSFDWLKNQLAD
jgi:dienelactone hydrolase